MAELWIPRINSGSNDDNIFDTIVAFQDGLDSMGLGAGMECARDGAQQLTERVQRLPGHHRKLSLVSNFVMFRPENEGEPIRLVDEDLGVKGMLNSVEFGYFGKALPRLSYLLDIEIVNTFSPQNPDDTLVMLSDVHAPISRVLYIETAA